MSDEKKSKIFIVDIDGTICTNTNGEYKKAEPYPEMISKINKLYRSGHIIKMMTARGATSGIDWTDFTKTQLLNWGVKYHELIMNKKPHGDIFIDDKSINAAAFKLLYFGE